MCSFLSYGFLFHMSYDCFRRARECTEEDISKMGKLPFGEGKQPHRRSVRRSERRQESSQAARGSLRGETGTDLR